MEYLELHCQDRITGRAIYGTKPGPKPYLKKTEEIEFLETTGEFGYGKTRKQVMNIVESMAKEKGLLRKFRINDGWFRRFIERQPQISLQYVKVIPLHLFTWMP